MSAERQFSSTFEILRAGQHVGVFLQPSEHRVIFTVDDMMSEVYTIPHRSDTASGTEWAIVVSFDRYVMARLSVAPKMAAFLFSFQMSVG